MHVVKTNGDNFFYTYLYKCDSCENDIVIKTFESRYGYVGEFKCPLCGIEHTVKINKGEFDLRNSSPAPKACGLVSKYLDGRIILSGYISPEPGKEEKPKFMYSDKNHKYCLNTYEQYLRMRENLCPICGSPIKPGGWISDPKCKKCKKTLFEMFDKKEAVYYIK